MTASPPVVPAGSGQHPIVMVAIAANDLAASTDFYRDLFGWQTQKLGADIVACITAAGPTVTLRANTPAGFPGVVPFLRVDRVADGVKSVIGAGGALEREPWVVPVAGTLARFKDPSGTIYGLTDAVLAGRIPAIPPPFGDNPKPAPGSVCSVEMYAADGAAAAGFFGDLFGWGSVSTMPQYVMFDPGAGIGGVFQSHTPALSALAYLYVTDVGATLDRIEAHGGKRTAQPMSAPGMGTFGYFADPSGTNMGLIGP